MRKLCVMSILLCLSFQLVRADVLSAPCPFSCKSNGYSKKICKDWKQGNTCFIEVKKKDGIDARPCPHSCRTMGIKKKFCKDWRNGDMCYVQDLRK
jgi:hypothetical protein